MTRAEPSHFEAYYQTPDGTSWLHRDLRATWHEWRYIVRDFGGLVIRIVRPHSADKEALAYQGPASGMPESEPSAAPVVDKPVRTQ
jgi:hypothetical protein